MMTVVLYHCALKTKVQGERTFLINISGSTDQNCFLFVGHQGEMYFWGGKNPEICRKWMILYFIFPADWKVCVWGGGPPTGGTNASYPPLVGLPPLPIIPFSLKWKDWNFNLTDCLEEQILFRLNFPIYRLKFQIQISIGPRKFNLNKICAN